MNKNFVIIILCSVVYYTAAELKCDIKKGIDTAKNKISDAATKGLQYHDGRNKGNMQIFECTCEENFVSFKTKNTFFRLLNTYHNTNFSIIKDWIIKMVYISLKFLYLLGFK